MSAGRDVERLISTWLTDEASDRSRDRVLEAVREAVDRMPQRRFRAAWREPVYLSPLRLAGLAAVLTVAILGAAFVGRTTAPSGPGSQPSASPSPAAGVVTLEAYRIARSAVCGRYNGELGPMKDDLTDLYDETATDEERAAKAAIVADFANRTEDMVDELDALQAPPDLAVRHALNVDRYRRVVEMLRELGPLLVEGDLAGAQALDEATDPLSAQIAEFENAYDLVNGP